MGIHPSAVVHPKAEIGLEVDIGPLAHIGEGVVLHDKVEVGPHAVVVGLTEIGAGTRIFPHSVLGTDPQDVKHQRSAPTRLKIGQENVFREFTSVSRGSSAGRGITEIGDRNYVMCNSHIGHDASIGSDCMFANSAAIAGHVQLGDRVVFGGLAGVHQFCRVGRLSMIAAGAICTQDVPPFSLVQGDRARLFGLNLIGLKRAGLAPEAISGLQSAWRVLFGTTTPMRSALSQVQEIYGQIAEVIELVDFIQSSSRGVPQAAIAAGRAA